MKAQANKNKQLQALLRSLKPKPDHLRTSELQQLYILLVAIIYYSIVDHNSIVIPVKPS